MSNLSSGDEEIMRLATEGEDDTKPDAKADAKPEATKGGAGGGGPDETVELELGGDDAPPATPEQIAEDEEKKRGRSHSLTSRVNQLTARLRQTERELAEERAAKAGASQQPVTLTVSDIEAKKPDPANFEFGTLDPDYGEALTDWKLDLREAKASERERETLKGAEQETVRSEITAKLADGMSSAEKQAREAYGDFDDVIQSSLEARDGEPLPPLVSIGCAVSPVGGHVAYHLAKNEADSEKIEKLAETDPRKAAVMLGELEGQYLDDDDDTDLDLADQWDLLRQIGRERARRKGLTKPTTIKTTRAPVEEKRARGSAGKFEVDDDTTDFPAFERKHLGGSR